MKARVKATGEIGIVTRIDMLLNDDFVSLSPNEVELLSNYADNNKDKLYDELDEVYWENLKHQYAGMAMQGMLSNAIGFDEVRKEAAANGIDNLIGLIAGAATDYATALVNKLKEEK